MSTERDYKILSDEELKELESVTSKEVVSDFGSTQIRKNLFHEYPKAVRHNLQLFPNQYLDTQELRNSNSIKDRAKKFKSILDSDKTTEQSLLNQINSNKDYFIIGSILKKYFHFGHHEAHIFREFRLGTTFIADYLLLGRSSDGWHLVFVELESPKDNITKRNGELGSAFRKGLAQIDDWKMWLEQNFSSLQEFFRKHIKQGDQLPDELLRLDTSRINYVVIAGRRDDFHPEKTYRIQRKTIREQQVYLIHYDNLLDAIEDLLTSNTY